jgi:hypothetical protein
MKKPRYKIVEINGFWRFHVYKRNWSGWVKLCGKD